MNEMMQSKLSPELVEMIRNQVLPDPVSVIVQVKGEGEGQDRLIDEDRQMVETVGGTILDDLWLINGFSCDLPAKALEMVVLSPRVVHIHLNTDVAGNGE